MNGKGRRVAQMDEWKEWKPGIVAGVNELKSGRSAGKDEWKE